MSRNAFPAALVVFMGCSETCALGFHGPDDILQIADAAGQPVNSGDHQTIAFAKKIQNGLKSRDLSSMCRFASLIE